MARSFVLGGTSATGIATGVPFIRRIVRRGSVAAMLGRPDEYTAVISGHKQITDGDGVVFPAFNQGSILNYDGWFYTDDGLVHPAPTNPDDFSNAINSSTHSRAWNVDLGVPAHFSWLTPYGFPGEMLHVEFPATTRTFSVQFEAENYALVDTLGNPVPQGPVERQHRVRVMLTAPGQKVTQLDDYGNPLLDSNGDEVSEFMDPINEGNYIEIVAGETATFNVRTNHFFMFIATHDTNNVFDDNLSGDLEGLDSQRWGDDAVSLLVTGILEHDGMQSRYGTATKVIGADGQEKQPIKKIYPQSVNIDNNTSGVG